MLEAMRRNSRGTIIYVMFGILIAVFVISFGPGGREGCGGAMASSYAAKVSGVELPENEYRLYVITYMSKFGGRIDPKMARQFRLKELLMDKLIERELLAQEAERLGFRVSSKDAEDLIKSGHMILLGREEPWGDVKDGFDYKRFRSFVENSLGVSVARFIGIQQREMLANRVRELMAGSVKVSPAEAEESYEQKERQANLEFVRFSPKAFEGDVDVTPEQVAAYQKEHEADLHKTYDERAFLYKKVEKQARARRILVELGKDVKDEEAVQKAERKANKAKGKLGDGAKDFAKVAKEMSDDTATKNRGGDLGWHKKGYFGMGEEIESKIFEAKPGDVIGPIRSDAGFELLKVEGFREGDVPYHEVAAELAEDKLRTEQATAKAKEAATAALEKVKAGESLEAQFPKKDETPAEGEEGAPKPKSTAPHVEETGSFPQRGELVPQIGISKEVMDKAFKLKQGESAGPFEVSGSVVIVTAKERREPDKEWFEKHKTEEMREIERKKFADVMDAWAQQRCVEVNSDGRIKVSSDAIYYDTPGDTNYQPCSPRAFQ